MQQVHEEAKKKGDDRPEQKPPLAGVGPDGAKRHACLRGWSHAGHIPHELAIAGPSVRAAYQIKPPQARLDCAPTRARERVDARARGLEQQRVGKTRATRLGFVALNAFGLKSTDDLVVPVGRRVGRAQRVAAGMRAFVDEGGIVDAARFAIERAICRARDGDRSVGAVGGVDASHDDPRQGAWRTGQPLDQMSKPSQRKGLARAGGADDRRHEGRLDLRDGAQLRQGLDRNRGVKHVDAVG